MLYKQNVIYFWIVVLCAVFLASIIYIVIIYRFNWNQLVTKALERAKISPHEPIPEEDSFHLSISEKTNLIAPDKRQYRASISRRYSYHSYQPSSDHDIITP